eukprot:CAMPEP_0194366820 /NCGR_PEP_ID=MMETSP0174-20130528/14920_1 /TAXON_ID=216777 /ORGANISM="Proboscia alata, Strain PI-D3" /LENGTH=203 /DNA_ID=CAMNT_0039142263 /DNA_START=75 /DNA_END=686 /DNA_ORIENTATION=+
MGLGKEDTSASDATLEGSKDNDAAPSEEEEDTGDEQISTLQSELQTTSNSNILNCGSKKRNYCMANTTNWQQNGKLTNGRAGGNDGIDSDLDAEMEEEEAGHKIQKAWYTTMDEDEFLPNGVAVAPLSSSPPKSKQYAVTPKQTNTNCSIHCGREGTMEKLERDNPEFLPLVQHFPRCGVQELTEWLFTVLKQLSNWKQTQVR